MRPDNVRAMAVTVLVAAAVFPACSQTVPAKPSPAASATEAKRVAPAAKQTLGVYSDPSDPYAVDVPDYLRLLTLQAGDKIGVGFTSEDSISLSQRLLRHEQVLRANLDGKIGSGRFMANELLGAPETLSVIQPAYSQGSTAAVVTPAMLLDVILAQKLILQRLEAIEVSLKRSTETPKKQR